MNIQLSDHFTYRKLFRFTLPTVVMMVFTSIYGVVDGLLVSNFVGKTAFAAINMIWPYIMLLGCVGFLFGTGGSALIAQKLGERRPEQANNLFSLFVYTSVVIGIAVAVIGRLLLRPIALLQGAEGALLEECMRYGSILLIVNPLFIVQLAFQNLFITAEKPQLGMWSIVACGVANMVLDWLFMAVFHWGIPGAALATAISQAMGGALPLIYFSRPNTSLLRLTRCSMDGKALLHCCINGSSELMSNVSMSLVNILYNMQLMHYAGQDGVAAYGAMMYVSFVFLSIFIGYSIGVAPVVSFHYGALDHQELKNLRRKSFVLIGMISGCMLLLSILFASPLSRIFVGYDPELFVLTRRGFFVYSFAYPLAAVAIFSSSFFTALGDGLTSAIISFFRTLVFQIAAVLLLPLLWGVDGIWWSIVAAELAACILSLVFLSLRKRKYCY